jgi:hypothetical protein
MNAKTKNIHDAMDALYAGKAIQPDGTWGRIWMDYGQGGRYIFWLHYGGSAERVSLRDLRWIFRVIFESKTYNWHEYVSEYL